MKSKDDIMSGYKAIFEDGYRAGRAKEKPTAYRAIRGKPAKM